MRRSDRKSRGWLWRAVFLGLCGSGSLAQESAPANLGAAREADAAEVSTFALYVTVEREVSWVFPEQGRYTEGCTLTRSRERGAIICQTDYLPTPKYRAVGTGNYSPRDYDPSGNLYICMPTMHLALWTEDRNETYQEHTSFSVDPEGKALATGVIRALNRYAPDDRHAWSRGEMRKTWWALGQGIASGFQQLNEETIEADGRRRLHVRGTSNHGPLEGEWDVVIEPSTGHLIRSASFQLDVLEATPGLEIETRGLRWFGGLALPEEGVVRSKLGASGVWLEKRVALKSFSHQANEQAFARVREILDNAATADELTVYDYRENRTRPTVTHERSRVP